ncbi:CNT_collapsed_G0000790.mRNA.1.CDS.1 [Saccharomyces cerevisiae]|nr:CNB_1a_G0000780.mRNA.1.CDS.1 [Saccharomyces cerevisiae]CAI6382949.1 CNT_HP1_G0000750.mRNA.1.CDS.1 [Saccharomyces cerevisiae]CAI7128436.1 CNB_1a_G0000780.mRNA.1.CDS.1 [Saccharomyces cerevisiae]CAI7130595.1 CNT_collapsed_G0000790.mRNA.1.CDS.1 [Saccharomyces cerevisiae]
MSSSPLLSRNAEDTQSSVSAGKTSNGPNNFDSIRSDPILMAYVLKATQIEKEAQNGANLVEGNVVLSKDMFNSYLSYSLYELRGGSL